MSNFAKLQEHVHSVIEDVYWLINRLIKEAIYYGLFDDLDDLAALYFVAVATAAALVGQHLVRKVIAILGRASVIIFILTLTLCVSAVLLGKT